MKPNLGNHLFARFAKSASLVLSLLPVATAMPAPGAAKAEPLAGVQENFGSGWRFHPCDTAPEPVGNSYDDSSWDAVGIPHTFKPAHRWLLDDADDPGAYIRDGVVFKAPLDKMQSQYHRRAGWYRKAFEIPNPDGGRRWWLVFDGAMQTTKVWVNGRFVGENAVGGYTPFSFDITKFVHPGPDNMLAVRVDHTVAPHAPPDPHTKDYMQFGGLYRNVRLVSSGPLHIPFAWTGEEAGLRVVVESLSPDSAAVRVDVAVRNEADSARKCVLETKILDAAGKCIATSSDEIEIHPGAVRTVRRKFPSIANPRFWSPDSPYLYSVVSKVWENGRLSDIRTSPLGLRTAEFSKKTGFSLNGKKLFIDGHCRHQFYPFAGEAVPDRYQWFDAWMLRQIGNAVRTSHYPQAPAFLDACDHLGLLVLEEPPTWIKTGDALWYKNLAEALRRMIRRDRNHPSIVTWSVCINHGKHPFANKEAGIDAEKITRAEDPTRNATPMDFSLPMCYGNNLPRNGALASEYPNWGGRWYRWDEMSMLDQTRQWLAKLSLMKAVPSASGAFSWLAFDYNTPRNAYYQHTICPNGAIDQYRIPKHVYYAYRARFDRKPMVFIADDWSAQRGKRTFVEVFSNCEKVALKLNGKPLGLMEREQDYPGICRAPFKMALAFEPGTLEATGLIGGKPVVEHIVKTPAKPSTLKLASDYDSIIADGADWTRIVVSLVDDSGTVVNETRQDKHDRIPALRKVEFSISGDGRLLGDNPTTLEAGKMIILAQATTTPGSFTVRAKCQGMRPAEIVVSTTPPAPDGQTPDYIPDNDLSKVWRILDDSAVVAAAACGTAKPKPTRH